MIWSRLVTPPSDMLARMWDVPMTSVITWWVVGTKSWAGWGGKVGKEFFWWPINCGNISLPHRNYYLPHRFIFRFTEFINSLFLLTISHFYSFAHKICIWSCSLDLDARTKISGTTFLRYPWLYRLCDTHLLSGITISLQTLLTFRLRFSYFLASRKFPAIPRIISCCV